ncbi:hypothetical protein XF24_00587 [candidate division SR1 bacterium Aalborg_AAW-1]|nr:hypothetical protein XF24_00587 [candidate division SR1 bacterium Aalborg_AAW-1]
MPNITIHPALFEFLNTIQEHNSRKYFASIRPLYDDIMHDRQGFIKALAKEFTNSDPSFAELDVKKCLFRIYRDARRLKTGDPIYKNNFGALIHPEGKKTTKAAPYIHLQPGNSMFAGGIYRADNTELNKIRTYLTEHGSQYYKIIESKEFKQRFGRVSGNSLTNLPRGRDSETPYPELVKKKQFLIYRSYTDAEVLSDSFFSDIVQDYLIAKSFFDMLNSPLQES